MVIGVEGLKPSQGTKFESQLPLGFFSVNFIGFKRRTSTDVLSGEL